MSLHIAPLLTGVAIGAVVTYLIKDEKAKNAVQSSLKKTGDTLHSGVEKVTSGSSGKHNESAKSENKLDN